MLKLYFNTLNLYIFWCWLELRAAIGTRTPKKRSIEKKALLLSFKLPPQFDSGTHRPLSFVRYAKRNGWDIRAVTNLPDKPITDAGKQLQALIPPEVTITEYDDNFTPSSYRLTPKIDGGLGNALSLVKHGLKTIKQERPSVIVASAPSFNYLVAGFFLSRICGIPLVLDYRDEWTLCPFKFVSKTKLDEWFEKRCIKQARLITYTTESHLAAHQQHFQIDAAKQHLVFNGWNNDVLEENQEEQAVSDEHILISYIGRLSGHVELGPFLQTLNLAVTSDERLHNRVTVQFIGEKTPALEQEIVDFAAREETAFTLISIPQVTQHQALKAMSRSSFLLLLCNRDLASYIPGKVYDYLSARVPIIAFGFPGEVSKIIQQLDAGVFVENEKTDDLIQSLTNKGWLLSGNQTLTDWLHSRTREQQAAKMYALLNDIG